MAIPGLLIEYLITGCLALVWLYPILKQRSSFELSGAAYLPLLALGLYVAGLAIDTMGFYPLVRVKHRIRELAKKRYQFSRSPKHGVQMERSVKFALYAPEIAKEAAMRSSRDRIARGALINSAVTTIIAVLAGVGVPIAAPGLSIWILAALMVIFLITWPVCEFMSHSYELIAERALDEKIWKERGKQ